MSDKRANFRHRTAVRLSPGRVACLVAYPLIAGVLLAAAALIVLFQRAALPDSIEARLLDRSIEPHPWVWWFVVGAALLGMLFLGGFVATLRRAITAREVRGLANDPALAPPPSAQRFLPPPHTLPTPGTVATSVPALQVASANHRSVPKPQAKRRRVTSTSNVFGWPPITIGY